MEYYSDNTNPFSSIAYRIWLLSQKELIGLSEAEKLNNIGKYWDRESIGSKIDIELLDPRLLNAITVLIHGINGKVDRIITEQYINDFAILYIKDVLNWFFRDSEYEILLLPSHYSQTTISSKGCDLLLVRNINDGYIPQIGLDIRAVKGELYNPAGHNEDLGIPVVIMGLIPLNIYIRDSESPIKLAEYLKDYILQWIISGHYHPGLFPGMSSYSQERFCISIIGRLISAIEKSIEVYDFDITSLRETDEDMMDVLLECQVKLRNLSQSLSLLLPPRK